MPFQNPSDAQIQALLQMTRTIAVVGLSDKPQRASYIVSSKMQTWGFDIIPISAKPQAQILGAVVYRQLSEVTTHIDCVDVFVRSEVVGDIVDQAIALGIKLIWLQKGISDEAAALRAQAAGLCIVMDRCLMTEYQRLFPQKLL
ncbi:CoA-binding protein [Deefgea salmonis]|uniref:CoA-binding protein n=1 Tax=Deefgea salmonis TaxID=2875502 RepID=A0ABS8BPA6_9NEIS|nr:CoA-binding protein [Deefgea salmonis]MCB5197562.1 CoA-binding protein [Deefgea salmonis]